MAENTSVPIYIGEKEADAVERLHMLIGRNALLSLYDDFSELLTAVNSNRPHLVLMNIDLLVDWDSAGALFAASTVIVYGDAIELEDRLHCYRLGVRRVISFQENSAHHAGLLGRQLLLQSNGRPVESSDLTRGRIDVFTLPELLHNAMLESKSLILKASYRRWQATVRLFEGQLVGVDAPGETAESALQKLLLMTSGTFRVGSFQPEDGELVSEHSLWSFLVGTEFLRQQGMTSFGSERDWSQIKLRFKGHESGISSKLPGITKASNLLEFILNSPLQPLEAIRSLQEAIHSSELSLDGSEPVFPPINDEDLEFVAETLFTGDESRGSLVILGLPSSGRSELIRSIAGSQNSPYKSAKSLEFTRIKLPEQKLLTLIGISTAEAFLPILEKLSEGMLAAIFLVDAERQEQFEFSQYVLNQVLQLYAVPFVIGVSNLADASEQSLQNFLKAFPIPEVMAARKVRKGSFEDLRDLLEHLAVLPKEEDENL